MSCRCSELEHLHGASGHQYEKEHLREMSEHPDTWQVLLQCPETGAYWKKWYPHPEAHGGGAPNYVKIPKEIAAEEFDLT